MQKLAPHLDSPVFAPLLQSFCRITLMLRDCYERLRLNDPIGPDGEIRPSVDTLRRLMQTQSQLATALGLTPATLAALTKEKPIDLAAFFAIEANGRARD
jgi:hypothetical protein